MSEKNLGVYTVGESINSTNFESLYYTQNTDVINFSNVTPAAMDFKTSNSQTLTSDISKNSFNLNMPKDTNKNGFWKYEEDKTLKEVEQYLSSTYHSHYTSQDSKTQTLDLIESIGDAEPFTRSNAIKYLSRFGKKNGKSKQDILKAIHYCILLYHFAGLHKNTNSNFPY
jgi:hypothetical protein